MKEISTREVTVVKLMQAKLMGRPIAMGSRAETTSVLGLIREIRGTGRMTWRQVKPRSSQKEDIA
jgi:hypothetical protein